MLVRGKVLEILQDRKWAILESSEGTRAFLSHHNFKGDFDKLKVGQQVSYIEETQNSDQRIAALDCKITG